MKLLICTLAVSALGILAVGCSQETPGLTANERFGEIAQAQRYNNEEMNDDIDSFLFLRPQSPMTLWNVVHRPD
jgi:hypothetical protein